MAAVSTTEPAVETSAIKGAIRECDRKLERYRQALEVGTEPTIVAGWIKQVTAERAAAEAQSQQAQLKATETVTPAELRAELEAIGGLLPLLEDGDPVLKAKFNEEVGLEGTYDPKECVFEARVLNGRVGGGTQNKTPRRVGGADLWLPAARPGYRPAGWSPLAPPKTGSPNARYRISDAGCNIWVRGWSARVITTGWFLPFVIRNVEPKCFKKEGADVLA